MGKIRTFPQFFFVFILTVLQVGGSPIREGHGYASAIFAKMTGVSHSCRTSPNRLLVNSSQHGVNIFFLDLAYNIGQRNKLVWNIAINIKMFIDKKKIDAHTIPIRRQKFAVTKSMQILLCYESGIVIHATQP